MTELNYIKTRLIVQAKNMVRGQLPHCRPIPMRRLFFFALVLLMQDVAGMKDMSSLCPTPDITLKDGQGFHLSQENFSFLQEEGSFANCQLRLMPEFYSSTITYERHEFSQQENVQIFLVSFDPTDPNEFPVELISEIFYHRLQFEHMALRVHILVYPKANFNISFTLKRDSSCGKWQQTPTNFYQYIRSPNYPQPFPEGKSCSWKISAPIPFQIEIVSYDGSETCDNHKLRILSIFEPDARRRNPELSRVYDQENTICRSTKPQFIYADEVFDQPYSVYTTHVLFYNENNKNNSKGFSLRYKFHESSEQEMPKAALSMGNVESASSNERDVDSWCPPDVVLERGQEFVLSSHNFTSSKASGRIAKCVMTVRSKYFDTTILMYLKRGYSEYGRHQLRYLVYSPLDVTEELFQERNFQTITARREYEFEHQVVKIDMAILSFRHGYGNQYEFDLVFKLQEEPLCGSESRKVSFNDGYVGSPNYPESYSQSVTCRWTFSGWRPFQFELLDYDGGETCADQYLLINYGPSDERQILICGKTENGILNDGGIFEGNFEDSYDHTFTATIVFHKANTDGDHTGFLLRYKLIDGDFDWDHRGRPRTIRLVGLIVLGVAGFLLLVLLGIKVALRWKRRRLVEQEKQEALQKSLIGKWLEHSLGERETNKFSEFLVGKIKLKSTPPSVSDPTETAQDKPLISSSGFGMSEEDVERRENGLNAALLSLNFSEEEGQHNTAGRANHM